MAIQFGQIALLVVFITGFMVFSVYSVKTARRFGIFRYLSGLLFLVTAIICVISKFAMSFIGLLDASAGTSDEEDEPTADPFRGGALNYRTWKLDDGTDPYGWYEEE